MNLTTPPPVETLDAEYADDLRHQLVSNAYRRARPPKWVPVLAATCGVAIIATGVVVLSKTSPQPAGAPQVAQVPADQSPVESVDLGPANPAEGNSTLATCLAQKVDHDKAPVSTGAPATLDPSRPRTAHWLTVPEGTRLLQTAYSTDGWWYQCLDDDVLRTAGSPGEFTDLSTPISGRWGIAQEDHAVRVEYSFMAASNVAWLELRIRWTGGASSWYRTPVVDNAGYVVAVQPGAVDQSGQVDADIRAFDQAGKQLYSDSLYS
ncbi:hypothetical protein AB0E69_10185 [Kribbella sp. NPDC026611]|uniref:hypothetical protein n=1 Tax=Kribbella sp. NPDC026611 TaxID=3154911 RepID=UPI0033F88E79